MVDVQKTCVLLIDNGSMRADATLRLRVLAEALGNVVGVRVYPVSLRHADKIDAAELNGQPALVFSTFLERQLSAGQKHFIVLPLFFGCSKALTAFIPEQVQRLKKAFGDFELKIADELYPLPEGDARLADILYEHASQTAADHHQRLNSVVLVDHGSPTPAVTQVRQALAVRLQELLGNDVTVGQAVMERREGKQYDFNGDLLEDWLSNKAEQGVRNVVVALLFSLPGRHAGSGGDIDSICQRAMSRYPELTISVTPLVSEHAALLTILESRLRSVYPQLA